MRRRFMLVAIALAALVVLAIGIFAYREAAARRFSERPLLELGTLAVPGRLENRSADESPERVVFRFEAVGGSLMPGSHTPIRERLTFATWAEGAEAAGERGLRETAIERVQDIRWRREGDLEIGEGTHRVNTQETPAWVILHRLPGQPIALGYMVWKTHADRDQARATLRQSAQSFRPRMSSAAFLALVRDRPLERRAALAKILGERGVSLTMEGAPVEKDGTFYSLGTMTSVEGAWLLILHPLGSLEGRPGAFRQNWSNPSWIGNWPRVFYFRRAEGQWTIEGTDGVYTIPTSLASLLARRHTDPARVYFYAAKGLAVDETPPEGFGLDVFFRVLPEMEKRFAAGELILRD